MPAYVHQASVVLSAGTDVGAMGGAVTTELCGHWVHEPPCPVAPHHTGVCEDLEAGLVRLRILFVARPDRVDEIRQRIDLALAAGAGGPSGWELVASGPGTVTTAEQQQASRMAASA